MTSAQSNGAMLTRIDLKLDKTTKDVVDEKRVIFGLITAKYEKDPAVTKLLEAYEKIATPLANRIIGKLEA